MMSRTWLVGSSREQDISSKRRSRDLISKTIKSKAESMTQLNDMHFSCLSARKVLREEIVDSKLNTQSMEGPERNAKDGVHVIASQERLGEKTR